MSSDIRLSLRTLRAFATVVEYGSINRAARALNVAPSAVASAVGQVETEFGTSLLIRTRSKGITATAEGRAMATRFRRFLEDYQDILSEGRDITSSFGGTLRIGYYAPVAPAFLPHLLQPIMADNPNLTLELQAHDNASVQTALLEGRVDLILFTGQDLRSGIKTQDLLTLAPYALVPKAHPIAGMDRCTFARLAQEPIVQLDRPLARPYVDGLFQSAGVDPDIVARSDSTEMVRSLVGSGMGVAVLSMRPRTMITYGGDELRAIPLDADAAALNLVSGHAAGQPRMLVRYVLEQLQNWSKTGSARALYVQ
ncbi:MAG: LysR family transcriptional regulator [Pseudomonadota bacterium]